jgi:hypothetical protein
MVADSYVPGVLGTQFSIQRMVKVVCDFGRAGIRIITVNGSENCLEIDPSFLDTNKFFTHKILKTKPYADLDPYVPFLYVKTSTLIPIRKLYLMC